MSLIARVIGKVQTLMQEFGQDSSYNDPDAIVRYIGIVNEDLEAKLQGMDLNYDTDVVILSDVPANTTDLSSYQQDGGPLEQLIEPSSTDGTSPIDWRIAGQSDLTWASVPMVGKILDTDSGTDGTVASIASSIQSAEWRKGIIFISPANQKVDIRVRGQFLPTLANNDASPYIVGLGNIIAYATCQFISSRRGGPGEADAAFFGAKLDDALYDFECRLQKAGHSQEIRLGGRRTQFCGNGIGLSIPIIDNN